MIERPLLFSGPMVRALLAGTKTQTRRLIKLPKWMQDGGPDLVRAFPDKAWTVTPCLRVPLADGTVHRLRNPWLWPNEPVRLWVKETWAVASHWSNYKPSEIPFPSPLDRAPPGTTGRSNVRVFYRADGGEAGDGWRPSIFMPRGASRITLEITDVRAQRLQDISEHDARAEGIVMNDVGEFHCMPTVGAWPTARIAYSMLWDAINGAGAWASSPWVWAISFRRISHVTLSGDTAAPRTEIPATHIGAKETR